MAPTSRREDAPQADLISQTYQRLRELIIAGRLAPGTRIIETELADRLEVSRTPLRSALHRLQQEGWVVGSDTGKQLRLSVSPTTEQDALELYEIIGAIEGLAARWAASLPDDERLPLAGELDELNQRMRQAASGPDADPKEVFTYHSAFHVTLVEAVHAPRLHALHRAIKPQSDRYRRIYSTELVSVAGDAAAEHAAVTQAIKSGQPEEAERLARTNWSNAARRMGRIISEAGARGSW